MIDLTNTKNDKRTKIMGGALNDWQFLVEVGNWLW